MDNSSRRGFFGQLFAGLAGCLCFPLFKNKNKLTDINCELTKGPIFFNYGGLTKEWGYPASYWQFDGKGNIIYIVNNTGINLNSKSTSLSLTTYRS